ncbi:MAG: hypothetical protein Q3983_03040 [Capnocytophaga sp.]|nr:hypothetical protein [Capnocytophaga sp.]
MKKILLSLMAVTALVSCSKSDDDSTYITEGTFPKKIVTKSASGRVEAETTYTIQGGKILYFEGINYPVIGGAERIQQTITYNGDLPQKTTSVSKDDKYTEEYQYEGEKLTKIIKTEEGATKSTITSYSYSGDRLTKKVKETPINTNEGEKTQVIEDEFNYAGNLITVNTITYNRDAQGVKTNSQVSSTTYTVENDNLMKVERSGVVLEEYTYDDKPNVQSIKLLQKLVPDYFIKNNFSKNNSLTEKKRYSLTGSLHNFKFTYDYNEKGYAKTKKRYSVDGNKAESLEYTMEYTY